MNVPLLFRWRHALAAGFVALPSVALAQNPDPFAPPPRGVKTVEILHGTTKVWPPVRPPVVYAHYPPPTTPPRVTEEKLIPVFPEPQPAVARGAEETPKAAEPRTIIIAGYAGPYAHPGLVQPAAPWLVPAPVAPFPLAAQPAAQPAPPAAPTQPAVAAPAPATPAQPTVVVIREPAGESRPAPATVVEAPRNGVGTEVLLGIGLGAAGLGFGFAGWRRRAAVAPKPAPVPVPEVAHDPIDGVLLLGKYNAGPLPESAEKFDLGPSYHAEQQEKKKAAEKNQQAVLEFILSQNLALHAELAGPDAPLPEAVELDPELTRPAPEAG